MSDAEAAGEEGAVPLYTPSWVAQRLGVTPATLRTWHYRYGLGPTGRTAGGHRRYSRVDLDRLDSMRRLTLDGVAVGEAAQLSHPAHTEEFSEPEHSPWGMGGQAEKSAAVSWAGSGQRRQARGGAPPVSPAAAAHQVELLTRTATALDQAATSRIIAEVLRTYGVVSAWTDIMVPSLQRMGERFERAGDCIYTEHVLSECTRAALSTVVGRRHRWNHSAPVLLAARDGEQHVLALHALAAALAERGQPSVLLGASVPPAALAAAVQRLGPDVVFLWSQTSDTARPADLPATPRQHRAAPIIVLGGPGWPGRLPRRVDSLTEALHACTAQAAPGDDRDG